jgi:hypothetical protein
MARIASRDVFEAEELLETVAAWTEEELEELPLFYQEKAREYQQLANHAEE